MSIWDNMAERTPIDVAVGNFGLFGGDQCISPDQSKYWMTGYNSVASNYALGWIDVATNTFGGYVLIADNFAPHQLLIDPTGRYAYTIKDPAALTPVRDAIVKIDLSDGSTVATAFPVGPLEYRISMTPDGAHLTYGASRDATGGVSVNMWRIDTAGMTIGGVISSASGGNHPVGECAFTSNSATAVACDRDTFVHIVNMSTFLITSTIAIPAGYNDPYQCVMSADDSTCWIAMQHISALYDVVIPLDMSGLTWGTPVVLNSSTTVVSVSQYGPLRFALSTDETAILFAHTDQYWRAVEISTSTVLKTVALSEGVASEVAWHAFAEISDRKAYLASTDFGIVIWVEPLAIEITSMYWRTAEG